MQRAAGPSQAETAQLVGVNRLVVALWKERFRQSGMAGLADAKGRGRKPSITAVTQGEIVSRATRPPAGKRCWSVRSMAAATGVSKATVPRLWHANDLKPHLTRTFKLSSDAQTSLRGLRPRSLRPVCQAAGLSREADQRTFRLAAGEGRIGVADGGAIVDAARGD